LLLLASCGDAPVEFSSGIAFEDVSVIDVANGLSTQGMTVVVQDNRIAAVEPNQRVSLKEGVEVVPSSGMYLIPGLWDMHVHTLWEDLHELFSKLFVANGITGIRDMWGSLDIAAEWLADAETGRAKHPRFLVAGNLIDGADPRWPGSNVAATPEVGRAMVDSLVEAGADFIKVYSWLEPSVYRAIALRSDELGIPFAGHLAIDISGAEASDLGQLSIEHAAILMIDCLSEPRPGQFIDPITLVGIGWDVDLSRALFQRMRENQTWYVPTLVTMRGMNGHDPALTSDPRLRYLYPSIVEQWLADNPVMAGHSEDDWQSFSQGLSQMMDFTAFASEEGVPLLAGSDTPNPFALPGFGLHDELEMLVESGLTPLQALRAATIDAARFLEATDSLGTVEVGKVADLVLLGGNPLEDISNTRTIQAVMLSGRLLNRAALDVLLSEAEEMAKASNGT
jgi:hypothetical protein